MTDDAPAPLPLDGIRVVDCSRVLAGPFATMFLADLGADVVKVEPPGGDETRAWGPPYWGPPADGLSAYFASVNRNKRSIVVDLRTADGRHVLDLLAGRSDLLFHNAPRQGAGRLGLDAGRLAERHPTLVVAAVGGFPGEAAARPAYDLLAQAVSGLMSVTGDPDGEPTKAGVAVLDLIAGLELAVGALAALVGRRSTQVRSVEVGLVEAGVTSLVNVLANHLASGEEPRRHGNAHPNIVPYESFRTSDGHLAIAVGNDAQFAALLGVLGLSDTDGRYTTNSTRVTYRAALVPWLAEAIGRRGRDELAEALVANGVPAGPLLSVSGALEEMETAHGGAWLQETRGIRLAPSPLRLDGRRASVRRPPPTPGEHTSEILTELGLSAEAIDRLRADAVVH